MNKIFKSPIILSLLAASAFSVIGLEPSRAGNELIDKFRKCKVMKMEGKSLYKVKFKASGEAVYETSSRPTAKWWMKRATSPCW